MYCPDISPSYVFVFPTSNRRRSTYYTASVLVLPNVKMRICLKYRRQLMQLKLLRWFGMGTNCLELSLPADQESNQPHCFSRMSRRTGNSETEASQTTGSHSPTPRDTWDPNPASNRQPVRLVPPKVMRLPPPPESSSFSVPRVLVAPIPNHNHR